jgi:hypothetical protein
VSKEDVSLTAIGGTTILLLTLHSITLRTELVRYEVEEVRGQKMTNGSKYYTFAEEKSKIDIEYHGKNVERWEVNRDKVESEKYIIKGG